MYEYVLIFMMSCDRLRLMMMLPSQIRFAEFSYCMSFCRAHSLIAVRQTMLSGRHNQAAFPPRKPGNPAPLFETASFQIANSVFGIVMTCFVGVALFGETVFLAVRRLCHAAYKPDGKATSVRYSDVEQIQAYVPEVSALSPSVIACSGGGG